MRIFPALIALILFSGCDDPAQPNPWKGSGPSPAVKADAEAYMREHPPAPMPAEVEDLKPPAPTWSIDIHVTITLTPKK